MESSRRKKDLKKLKKAFEALRDSDYSFRLDRASSSDCSDLFPEFNSMAASVEGNHKKLKKKLLRHLYTDEMTDLPKRQVLMSDIQKTNNPVLFLINIDSFKEINDFYGNIFGDYTLIEVSNQLEKLLPNESYKLYKMPSDEYAILCDKPLDKREIREFALFLCLTVADTPITLIENDIYIKLTIGVSTAVGLAEKIVWLDLLKDADMALKFARKEGKSIAIYHESMGISKEYENNLKWAKIIREALLEDRIIPFFQPIYNNNTKKIEKYECLARIKMPDGRIILPNNFVHVAKKTGQYSEITRRMVAKSFEAFKDNRYEFSINLSSIDILNIDTNYYIKSKLMEYENIAQNVVFEILESEGIENYDRVKEFITDIKGMGCKIAIDDFGKGYSNFEYILKLDVDFIKIDGSLTRGLEKDKNSQIITKTIADFAKKLNIKTISEYVNTKGVFSKEKELGIDYSQGYFFGEPKETID